MWEIVKDYGEVLSAFVALVSGAALVYRKMRPHYRAISSFYIFMESDAFQSLNTLAKSGALEHLPTALSQLRPNGGDSLLDRVARIELAILSTTQTSRYVFTHQKVPFWQSDAEGKAIYINAPLLDIIGMREHEALGNGWVSNIHPTDRERVFNEWEDAVQQKRMFTEKYRFVRPDGTTVYVQGQATPVIDTKGNVTGYVGSLTPISEADF